MYSSAAFSLKLAIFLRVFWFLHLRSAHRRNNYTATQRFYLTRFVETLVPCQRNDSCRLTNAREHN